MIKQQMTFIATAHDTPVEKDTQLRIVRVEHGRRGWLWVKEEQECLDPFQADANEPHQPLTSLPEKQTSNVMSCHYSLQEQPMGHYRDSPRARTGLRGATNWPVGVA